jgi:acetate CoA/acetoacetate CoA-transferase alpha subunit
MKKQIITAQEAASKIKDGMVLMIGGFMAAGTPKKIIDAIVESPVKDLIVVCNDTAFPDKGIGKLIAAKKVKKELLEKESTHLLKNLLKFLQKQLLHLKLVAN